MRHLWGMGAIIYLAIVAWVGWRPILAAAADASPAFIGAALAVHLAALGGRVLKWRLALGAGRHAAGAFFISKAGGGVSPLRLGEFSPLLLGRFRNTHTTAWILIDRLFESGATLALGLYGLISVGAGRSYSLVGGAVAAAIVLVALPGWLLMQTPWLTGFAERFGEGTRLRRLALFTAGVSGASRSFKATLLWAAPATVLLTAADAFANILLYHALGHAVPFGAATGAHLVHVLVTLFPFTPNASGVPFLAGGAFIGHYAGVPKEILLFVIPLNYAMTECLFWTAAALGPWDLFRRKPAP